MLRAVELERRRTDDKVDIAAVVSDIHELRTIMSAAAQMMRSFNLERYGQMVKWGPAGAPDGLFHGSTSRRPALILVRPTSICSGLPRA
ncbi:hypothetical protein [Kribbella sp. NBC_00359]|uniref:hypothetical protein n=1 Tax=Kribbella sp. NBC_00359 TaxID=2975966 RepID=UPI002E1E41B5